MGRAYRKIHTDLTGLEPKTLGIGALITDQKVPNRQNTKTITLL
jgi:hypothetical protein